MNLVIFGPPGAGKGTQSNFIVRKFNLFKLSTGDLLRAEIKQKSLLGNKIRSAVNSGSLVSDEIINTLIENTVSNKFLASSNFMIIFEILFFIVECQMLLGKL